VGEGTYTYDAMGTCSPGQFSDVRLPRPRRRLGGQRTQADDVTSLRRHDDEVAMVAESGSSVRWRTTPPATRRDPWPRALLSRETVTSHQAAPTSTSSSASTSTTAAASRVLHGRHHGHEVHLNSRSRSSRTALGHPTREHSMVRRSPVAQVEGTRPALYTVGPPRHPFCRRPSAT